MTVRDEIHHLVDQIGEDRTAEVLTYLRDLVHAASVAGQTVRAKEAVWAAPAVVSGEVFFARPRAELESLAQQQGARPVAKFDDLLGDFWPENETADEFIAAVRQWRREGGHA